MGYRHYFYEVNIADCENVKGLTYEHLVEYCKEKWPEYFEEDLDGEWLNFHKILEQKRIFEFGKLYWDDTAERIYSKGVPLFDVEETQKRFSDYHPYRMGKDGLLEAINIYKEKVINYYNDLLVDGAMQRLPFGMSLKRDDIKSMDKLLEHIHDMIKWWGNFGVIDLDENHESISKSWLYEHQIFELVRLYKSIDWDKKCLLFYGW